MALAFVFGRYQRPALLIELQLKMRGLTSGYVSDKEIGLFLKTAIQAVRKTPLTAAETPSVSADVFEEVDVTAEPSP